MLLIRVEAVALAHGPGVLDQDLVASESLKSSTPCKLEPRVAKPLALEATPLWNHQTWICLGHVHVR